MDCDTGRLGFRGCACDLRLTACRKLQRNASAPSNWAAKRRAGKTGCKHTNML